MRELSDLPEEGPEHVEPKPPSSWPSEGAITVEDLAVQYSVRFLLVSRPLLISPQPDLPKVLHNISFRIAPGEKIGIIGRTGSGKSTLALSLLRFMEPTSGRILIDGLDIGHVGLTDLRSRLTIIPREYTPSPWHALMRYQRILSF